MKFNQGDMVTRRPDKNLYSVWIGTVYRDFSHRGEEWYVGQTQGGMIWVAKGSDLQVFECDLFLSSATRQFDESYPVKILDHPNPKLNKKTIPLARSKY